MGRRIVGNLSYPSYHVPQGLPYARIASLRGHFSRCACARVCVGNFTISETVGTFWQFRGYARYPRRNSREWPCWSACILQIEMAALRGWDASWCAAGPAGPAVGDPLLLWALLLYILHSTDRRIIQCIVNGHLLAEFKLGLSGRPTGSPQTGIESL